MSAREHQEDLGHTEERVIDSDLCPTVEKTNKRILQSMIANTACEHALGEDGKKNFSASAKLKNLKSKAIGAGGYPQYYLAKRKKTHSTVILLGL